MSLETGQMLGPYKIIEPAGAGGMGEVYKAEDTRLERTVAIKILNVNIASNPELKQRFEREAKSISSLNHPNICTLFDIGVDNNIDYLVMEFIEGVSLADKIKEGPIPIEELLVIATQVADALDKAHRQGLIHRDLKPGNIMLTKQGAKLLDFGLAKLTIEDGDTSVESITQTTPLTGTGTLIGTLQYMSPEQLEGTAADHRSDIFSFGVVMYEMATGVRAFEGKSQASLIASIMKEHPRSISQIEPMNPPMLEKAVSQCIAKDPDQRWQSAGDLKRSLQWISEGGSQVGIPAPLVKRRKLKARFSGITAIVMTLATLTLGYLYFGQSEPELDVTKFIISTGTSMKSMQWPMISPDGKLLTFIATDTNNVKQIWVRPLNSLEAYPLPGTESAVRPFWSPDSKQIGFFGTGQLKKISASGGPAQLICETTGADGHWGADNIILFDNNVGDSIQQVSAAGGVSSPATTLAEGENMHAWPWFIDDTKYFLYIAGIDSQVGTKQNFMLRVASLDGTVKKDLFRITSRPVYSSTGHILYTQDNTLMAQKFDKGALEIIGDPFPVAEDVVVSAGNTRPNFSVSNNGILIIQQGDVVDYSQIIKVDRSGTVIDTIMDMGYFGDIQLSPDENRLAYGLYDQENSRTDIWVRDLRRNVSSRLTFEDADEITPIWSSDGKRVAYSSNDDGEYRIKNRQANGIGEEVVMMQEPTIHLIAHQWIENDTALIGTTFKSSPDIAKFYPGENATIEIVIGEEQIMEFNPQMSNNGRFLAYCSNETGTFQIFIRDLSPVGGKWQVSADGGFVPKWRNDSKELFYRTSQGETVAVPISIIDDFLEIGMPEVLFERRANTRGQSNSRYYPSKDGQYFLLNVPMGESSDAVSNFIVTQNWLEDFK